MKKNLHPLLWVLISCLALLAAPEARATHILGGDLTYIRIGPTPSGDLYRVKFRFYRDCSGTTASNWDLHYRNTGCSGADATVRMNLVGNTITGAPYCAGTSNACSGSAPNPNYDLTTFQVDVTLAPGVWSLFIYEDNRSRPNIANLINVDRPTFFSCNGSENEMFLEATLDNTGTNVGNTSPQFDPQDLVVQYVGLNQRSTITYSATETDGDSLVYELVQPYDRCGTPIPYARYTGTGNTGGTVALPGGCTLTMPPAFATFSTAVPLPVALDTLGTCPNRRAVPAFYFNSQARTITFTPNVYNATGTPDCGYNKYQVVMRISEYRRIGGVRRVVGTVRREGVIIVLNSTNRVPAATPIRPTLPLTGTGIINRPDSLEVRLVVGNYARVPLNFTDPDPGQPLVVTYSLPASISGSSATPPSAAIIGTFTLVGNNTPTPVGTFDFQPSPSFIPAGQTERVERINFRAEDNACPVKGVQNRVLVIRVVSRTYLAGIKAVYQPGPLANAGPRAGLSPAPNTRPGAIPAAGSLYNPIQTCNNSIAVTLHGGIVRPNQVRALGTGAIVPQLYTYQWSVRNGPNLTPAQVTDSVITVTVPLPTAAGTKAVRYFLKVTTVNGFSPGVEDTTSILVRFLPPPTVTARATPTTACSAAAVTLTGTASRTDGVADTYTYTWSGGDLPAGTTGQTVTARPTATTTYNLTVTGNPLLGCSANASVLVTLAPTPTVAFTVVGAASGSATRPAAPITYTFTNNSTIAGGFALDSVRWTEQRMKDAKGAAVTEAEIVFSRRTTPLPRTINRGGEYIFRLYSNTTAGGIACPAPMASQTVVVPIVDAPNVITPNGDGQNDLFKVSGEQFGGKLVVYNRWGRKVEEFANYQNTWSAAEQSAGVYYYLLTDTQGQTSKGWVEVIK